MFEFSIVWGGLLLTLSLSWHWLHCKWFIWEYSNLYSFQNIQQLLFFALYSMLSLKISFRKRFGWVFSLLPRVSHLIQVVHCQHFIIFDHVLVEIPRFLRLAEISLTILTQIRIDGTVELFQVPGQPRNERFRKCRSVGNFFNLNFFNITTLLLLKDDKIIFF